MVFVAFDIGDFAFFHMHVDPAAAGTHVTSGLADFVRDFRRQIEVWFVEGHGCSFQVMDVRIRLATASPVKSVRQNGR